MKHHSFETITSGKWVLSGEHAVLRGSRAIALPHPSYRLQLRFVREDFSEGIRTEPHSLHSMLDEMIRRFENLTEINILNTLRGKLTIESSIPMGAGLGSSAALCVGLARWLSSWFLQQPQSDEDICRMGRELENYFHGTSSGMDISVCHLDTPVIFRMGLPPSPLPLKRQPNFTFHETGLRALTKDCIAQIARLKEESPNLGEHLDQEMNEATDLAIMGLNAYSDSETLDQEDAALLLLQRSMEKSRSCFLRWGLLNPKIEKLEESLIRQGAIATKITGAGLGGFVVALWKEPIYNIGKSEITA